MFEDSHMIGPEPKREPLTEPKITSRRVVAETERWSPRKNRARPPRFACDMFLEAEFNCRRTPKPSVHALYRVGKPSG